MSARKILIGLVALLLVGGGAYYVRTATPLFGAALNIFTPSQGGTGIGSVTAGDVGECLQVLDDAPFTWTVGTCGSGGGGGGATTWSYIFPGDYLVPATSTSGMIVSASSTIGSGTQAGGLTIFGGATTTGTAKIGNGSEYLTMYANSGGAEVGTANSTRIRINNQVRFDSDNFDINTMPFVLRTTTDTDDADSKGGYIEWQQLFNTGTTYYYGSTTKAYYDYIKNGSVGGNPTFTTGTSGSKRVAWVGQHYDSPLSTGESIHQHFNIETAQSDLSTIVSRLTVSYGEDVALIDFPNSELQVHDDKPLYLSNTTKASLFYDSASSTGVMSSPFQVGQHGADSVFRIAGQNNISNGATLMFSENQTAGNGLNFIWDSSNNYMNIYDDSGNANRLRIYRDSGNLQLLTGALLVDGTASSRFAGSVGIGNTSPNEKLNVQGVIAGQALYATSSAMTSLLSGGLSVTGTTTLTNATTTNIFSTTASSTNLFASAATIGNALNARFIGAGLTNGNTASVEALANGSLQGFRIQGTNTNDLAFSTFVAGDAQLRFLFSPTGLMSWGSGSAVTDTNLQRSGVAELTLTSNLILGNSTGTSATTTNSFSTTASSTNLFASVVTLGSNILRIVGQAVTLLGAWDFGGATSLEIPNGSAPVVDAIGEIAWDDSSGNLIVATSTNPTSVVLGGATSTLYAFSMASTSPDLISGGLFKLPTHWLGQVVIAVICQVDAGTSVVINLTDGTNDTNAVTCTTTEAEYKFTTNHVWTSYETIQLEVGTVTGAVDYLGMRFVGYRQTN